MKHMHPTQKFYQGKKIKGKKSVKVPREVLVKLGITAKKR